MTTETRQRAGKGEDKHFPMTALLEFLSPPPGWKVEQALCATYSAQCSVLAAMLIAMVGEASTDGKGSRIALARAFRQLKGKVHFLVQHGRLAAPGSRRAVLGLLDRFIVPVEYDERCNGHSWHPKVCLIRFSPVDKSAKNAAPLWRLWIGSRNFTRDSSWDIGFSLTSDPGNGQGQTVPGADELARKLAVTAGKQHQWAASLVHLKSARWQVPRGLAVREVHLLLPGEDRANLPRVPAGLTEVLAISPFLDTRSLRWVATAAAKAERTLISTKECMAATITTKGQWPWFHLLSLPSSSQDSLTDDMDISSGDDEEVEQRGLHAKLLWFVHTGGATICLGSPNLTERGWQRNAEAYVTIDVGSAASSAASAGVHKAIKRFRDLCEIVMPADLGQATQDDEIEKLLEDQRKALAYCLKANQQLREDNSVLVHSAGVPILPAGVTLSVGRVGDTMRAWPSTAEPIALPPAPRPDNSDLLQVRVAAGRQALTWLQHAPFIPELSDEERDLPLIQSYLGINGLLDWLSDALSVAGEGGGNRNSWDDDRVTKPNGYREAMPISVEAVLAAWARNREVLTEARMIVNMARNYAVTNPAEHASHERLKSFLKSWNIVEAALK